MKSKLKPSVIALGLMAAMMLAAPARADIGMPVLGVDLDPAEFFGNKVSMVAGSASLNLAPSVLAGFSAAGLSAQAVSPTSLEGDVLSLGSPQLWSGEMTPEALKIGSIRLYGGIALTAGDGASQAGATLNLTNFRINLEDFTVYARMKGAGIDRTNQALWTFTSKQGNDWLEMRDGDQDPSWHVGGLQFTLGALGDLRQAFALSDAQVAQLGAIGDVGSFAVEASLDITPSPGIVPEPSTWMLMGLGLCGVWAARRRRQTSTRASAAA